MNSPANNKEEVVARILSVKSDLFALGVKSIGLFGSFAKAQQTPESDVDLLIDFFPDKHSFDNFMDASFLLEDLLGRKVELVTPESLSPHIGPHIIQEVQCVVAAA